MRRMRILIGLLSVSAVCGAGMTTHTMAGYRAINYFGKIMHSPNASLYNDALDSNVEAVLAGSDFPDFLYACGKYQDHHSAGEFAHWPPFQKAMVQYIRETKPDLQSGNWTDQTKTLVAFLMGAGTHFMADELWEGMTGQLGEGQGFVRLVSTMALNHDGHSDNDETVANMAADFYLPWALDTAAVHPWKRVYPLEDIYNVYTKYTKFTDVTMKSLSNCQLLFDLGLWAEITFGALLFPWYAEVSKQVPIVAERLIDYPLGGIDDMAIWATFVWERLANWIDVGAPDVVPPRRRLLADEQPVVEDDRFTHDFLSRFEPFQKYHDAIVAIEDSSKLFSWRDPARPLEGLVYNGPVHLKLVLLSMFELVASSVLSKHDVVFSDLKIVDADELAEVVTEVDQSSAESSVEGTQAVAYAGAAVASGDLNGDGQLDLVYSQYGVGEPGRPQVGSVTVQYENSSQTVVGEHLHSWFGKSVVITDLNLDGIDDLIVGAPHASFNESEIEMPRAAEAHFRFWGKVFVYFGSATGISMQPDVTLFTEADLSGLGWVLNTGDLNGDGHKDLLMGCPFWSHDSSMPNQQGHLFALFASPSFESGQILNIDTAADISLAGPSNYDWFGQAVVALPGGGSMLVGAPGHRVNGTTVGAVYTFVNHNGSWAQSAVMWGTSSLGEFGHAIALDDSTSPAVVAVSAPATSLPGTRLRSGEVFLFHPTLTNSSVADVQTIARIGGTAPLARTGWLVDFQDCNDDKQLDLVIGSPMSNGELLYDHREVGAVAVWLNPVTGSTSVASADWSMKGSRKAGRMGSAFAALGGGRVAVGSPRATVQIDKKAREMAGVVDIFSVNK